MMLKRVFNAMARPSAKPSGMPMVICSARSRDFADMESVLARLLDVMLIALGAALASHFFLPEMGHSIVEGAFFAFVAFDMALAILLLPLFAHLRKFADWVRGEQIEEVWLALPMSEEHTVLRIIDEFSGDLVNLRFIPDVRSLAMFDRNVVDLIGTQ